MPDVQHQVGAIVGEARGETQLCVVRPCIHQLVVGLRRAEGVPVQAIPGVLLAFRHSTRLRVAIVEQTGVIVPPGHAAKPAPLQHFRVVLGAIDVAQVHRLPVAAVL
jgi:hypothetical protein